MEWFTIHNNSYYVLADSLFASCVKTLGIKCGRLTRHDLLAFNVDDLWLLDIPCGRFVTGDLMALNVDDL